MGTGGPGAEELARPGHSAGRSCAARKATTYFLLARCSSDKTVKSRASKSQTSAGIANRACKRKRSSTNVTLSVRPENSKLTKHAEGGSDRCALTRHKPEAVYATTHIRHTQSKLAQELVLVVILLRVGALLLLQRLQLSRPLCCFR